MRALTDEEEDEGISSVPWLLGVAVSFALFSIHVAKNPKAKCGRESQQRTRCPHH